MARATLPPPLTRCPDIDMEVRRAKADAAAYAAVERVAGKLLDGCDSHVRMTKAHLLRSLKLTHQSMVVLDSHGDQEHSGDLLPLARLQLERVSACMLLEVDAAKYLPRFRKAAWKASATKFWRDPAELGHLDHCKEYYQTKEQEMWDYGHVMDATDDEIATLKADLRGEQLDTQYTRTNIPDMPSPACTEDIVKDPGLKVVARRFYLAYNERCHHSHGGFLGVMIGGLLGGHIRSVDQAKADTFFEKQVVEPTFPCSYVAMMTAATLFGIPYRADPDLLAALVNGWSPHLCDGTALGIVVWDAWAKQAMGAMG